MWVYKKALTFFLEGSILKRALIMVFGKPGDRCWIALILREAVETDCLEAC